MDSVERQPVKEEKGKARRRKAAVDQGERGDESEEEGRDNCDAAQTFHVKSFRISGEETGPKNGGARPARCLEERPPTVADEHV